MYRIASASLTTFVICLCLMSCKQKNRTIALQPFEGLEMHLTDTISKALENAYQTNVTVLSPDELPSNAFVNIKSPRYRADTIIANLKRDKPKDIGYVLGLTHRDISTTKRDHSGNIKKPEARYSDWGIFGLGYRPGPSSVVSTYRLRNSDTRLFLNRLKKVCIHEIGHNMGLPHCESDSCVMRDAAETIKTIDQVGMELCDKCLNKIF